MKKLFSYPASLSGASVAVVLLACSWLRTTLPTPDAAPPVHQEVIGPTATLSLSPIPQSASPPTETLQPSPTFTPGGAVRFAVIGDYGSGNEDARQVAELVKSWKPDFILTTGDNNYPDGARETIDHRIGQFYHEYIYPYRGRYGKGADRNRFFPTLGNHDWMSENAQPYLDYFELPNNERYYDFSWGAGHFFALDSDSNEPDGVGRSSRQAQWLQERLAASTQPWQIVFMHHPPYTSGKRGAVEWMRWPFKEWGVEAVLCGHDHFYERLLVDGLVYFINGAGGGGLYDFGPIAEGSQKRFNGAYGAMLVTMDHQQVVFEFFAVGGVLIDQHVLTQPVP
ncbi:MAG: metallophosphoesterase [Anaerolineales bacterium]|nr:metallophosphoesterase [Anaerolineales bacterium]MDW8162817.1 metallophosphoesterase [Anaerolineales bacterium]